jgi:hypothetical protein
MKEMEITKMEFLLTLNDIIIVQRFYNVRDYNSSVKNSVELYDLMFQIKNELQNDLKWKTVVYMVDNKNLIEQDQNVMNTSMTDKPEYFNMYIKVGEQTICHRQFDAKMYPPKIRYTVDVRPYLKSILKDLTDIFSEENLTYEYLGLPLEV